MTAVSMSQTLSSSREGLGVWSALRGCSSTGRSLNRLLLRLLDDDTFFVNHGKTRRNSGRNGSVFYWRPSQTSTERKRRLQMNKFRFAINVIAIAIFMFAFASFAQAQ